MISINRARAPARLPGRAPLAPSDISRVSDDPAPACAIA
jgi:hypothetical protein